MKLRVIRYLLPLVSFMLLQSCSLTNSQPEPPEFALAVPDYLTVPDDCLIEEVTLTQLPQAQGPDLWDRIRVGYALPPQNNKRIEQQLNWYARHPNYLDRVAKRGERYLHHIVEELEKRHIPLEIALLPIVESAFDPFAYSHSRASGIWQIIPGTGKHLGLKQNWWYDGRRDITASTDAALRYLESLHKRFDGDWLLALAAYNSGGGNVSKAIKRNKRKGLPTDFWNLQLPKETRDYVPRLIALSQLVENPSKYNLTLHSIPDRPYFDEVEIGSQIDLAQAAELAEMDMSVLYHLNPGFNRWATDPKGPHTLLVPVAHAEKLKQNIATIPNDQRVTWERYTIKRGDNLGKIAAKYNISITALKTANGLTNNVIRAGKPLMVPVAAKADSFYSHTQTQRLATTISRAESRTKGHKIHYTVKKGDSFWSISRRYNTSTTQLAKWNNMATKDPLKPGQNLVLWTQTTEKSSPTTVKKLSYKVRRGDSLARIADKFQLKVNDILRWNAIDTKKYLQPGQSLTLFVDVTKTVGS